MGSPFIIIISLFLEGKLEGFDVGFEPLEGDEFFGQVENALPRFQRRVQPDQTPVWLDAKPDLIMIYTLDAGYQQGSLKRDWRYYPILRKHRKFHIVETVFLPFFCILDRHVFLIDNKNFDVSSDEKRFAGLIEHEHAASAPS